MHQFDVLSDVSVLAKTLGQRGLSVRPNGRVWSQELETFVSAAEAFLAGLGKARRTASEQEVFDLLLVNAAGKAAVKAAKVQADKKAKKVTEIDREKELAKVVELQERMAKGMVIIAKTNRTISAGWERNSYAPYIHKAWKTPAAERTEGQRKSLSHPNNKLLVKWFEHRKALWAKWHELQAESQQLAQAHNLWGAFFALEATSFTPYGVDRRPVMRDEGLEWNEPASGLTGEWNRDSVGCMADEHVSENAALEAAFKACEYYKRKRYPQEPIPSVVGARVMSRAFGPGKVIGLTDVGNYIVKFDKGNIEKVMSPDFVTMEGQAMDEAELASLMAMADRLK